MNGTAPTARSIADGSGTTAMPDGSTSRPPDEIRVCEWVTGSIRITLPGFHQSLSATTMFPARSIATPHGSLMYPYVDMNGA